MSQDDERIARKLLDLTSRSDRVQIRNGMVYLDGYALGNGTVEIRSQVVRDRRRRWNPDQTGWAAALIYTVAMGEAVQFWLQDNGGKSVLLYTIPRRVTLGWSGTNSDANNPTTVGYLTSPPAIGLDIPRPYVDGRPEFGNNNPSIGYAVTGAGVWSLRSGPFGSNLVGGDAGISPSSGNGFYLVDVTLSYIQAQLITGGASTSITISSASNRANLYVQRRPEGTFVYTHHTPYNSPSTPPDLVNGIWQESLYWTSPGAGTDITASVVGQRSSRFTVSSLNPFLDGQTLSSNINLYPSARYEWSPFESMLSNGALVEGAVFIDKEDSSEVQTIRIKGAPEGADQVLSVAVYPR
jgi:hypothetical protein